MGCIVDITRTCDACLAISEDEFIRVCEAVLTAEGIKRKCAISVSIVGTRKMQELNLAWRGIDRPTDVISIECERPDDPLLVQDDICQLGDIVMSPEVLAEQAKQFGTSEADETRLMTIHSLLHLLGYDHIDESDALRMEKREDELLQFVCKTSVGHVSLTRHSND